MDASNERKLREFLFRYFYQISLNYEEMWALDAANGNPVSKYLSAKLQKAFQVPDPSAATMSEKYGLTAKLCLLDGVAKKWVLDGLQETPEEMIDYVMPIIQML